MPYLVGNVYRELGHDEADAPYIDLAGKNVVVLGGGDTGMDCNRTAIRQGAASVTCAYRRDEENMPGSRREVANSKEEGVEFLFNRQPLEILGDDTVTGVKRHRDATRARRGLTAGVGPEPIPGTEDSPAGRRRRHCFRFSTRTRRRGSGILRSIRSTSGRVRVDVDWARSRSRPRNPKVFAGGDMVRGSDLVVTAVHEGREAAKGIARFLEV